MRSESLVYMFLGLSLMACNIPHPGNMIEKPSNSIDKGISPIPDSSTPVTITPFLLTTTETEMSESPSLSYSQTSDITPTLEPGLGGISGNIWGYPYGSIPQLVIVAYLQVPPYNYWYEIVIPGSSFYSMTAGTEFYLGSGRYQVVAYDSVGHSGGCVSIVIVKANEMATCDISDWSGVFPAKPVDVP